MNGLKWLSWRIAVISAAVTVAVFGYSAQALGSTAKRPVVTRLSVSAGATHGGTPVIVWGRGFTHVRSVDFGSAKAKSVRVESSTKLRVTAPAHRAGRVDIKVNTSAGISRAVKADRFTYISRPAITGVAPAGGPVTGGTRVTVSGSNFRSVTAVEFGSVKGTSVTVTSPASLEVTAPAGSGGSVNVRVMTRYGTSRAGPADRYVYAKDTLSAGQTLGVGQALWSSDGKYEAVMQSDGNFVVYQVGGKALWATGTSSPGSTITMQADGNLVVYTSSGQAVWSSGTAPSANDWLVMQTDGNLVIYSQGGIALWDYGSGRIGSPDTLTAGNALHVGQALWSTDGRYQAVMQGDGNFVVYGPSGATWSTGTAGSGAQNFITMQTDGNLVVYTSSGQPVWSSGTAPSSGDRLIMQTDGNLVIYNGSGAALWALGQKIGGWAGPSFCASYGVPYMGTTYNGVAACGDPYTGPNSNEQGKITYNGVLLDSVGFQCYELAARYFYYVTGYAPPIDPYASDLAWDIHSQHTQFPVFPAGATGGTSTYSSSLVPGAIISMWSASDITGHVGVVTSVSLNSSESGSIYVMDENSSASGTDKITVTNGQMNFEGLYNDFQWVTGLPG